MSRLHTVVQSDALSLVRLLAAPQLQHSTRLVQLPSLSPSVAVARPPCEQAGG